MCWYFYIGSIDFMLKSKTFLDYAKLFSPIYKKNDKKNDKIILKHFYLLKVYKVKKSYHLICAKYKKPEKAKISYIFEKALGVLLFAKGPKMKLKKYLRRRINWDIRNSRFNWKYMITLKIWFKKI